MDTDYVWIIGEHQLHGTGISSNYIIPKHQMRSNEAALAGATVWLVLRGKDDRCTGFIRPTKTEIFIDDYHAGDFLLTCDLHSSIRFSKSYDSSKPYTTSQLELADYGISTAPESFIRNICEKVKANIPIKFLQPPSQVFQKIDLSRIPKRRSATIDFALSRIVQQFSLEELWSSGTGTKLGPFGNFAAHFLQANGYGSFSTADYEMLIAKDPIRLLSKDPQATSRFDKSAISVSTVDLDFSEIEPENIHARKFVQSTTFKINPAESLQKTEAAERLHQDMLRDISMYLKSNGLLPFESNSIDLILFFNDEINIYEIKSSNNENILSQASKGAFQLATYMHAMRADFMNIKSIVILHTIDNKMLEQLTGNILRELGIKHLIYDPKLPWPNRVGGLLI